MRTRPSMLRKMIAIICALTMVASLMPTAAFAEVGKNLAESTQAAQDDINADALELEATTNDEGAMTTMDTTLPASGTSGTCTWSISGDGKLTVSPTDGISGMLDTWDNEAPWASYGDEITTAVFESGVKAQTCRHMFAYYYRSLESVDLSGLDTSSVTDMSAMFSMCESLSSLKLASINTKNVTDMNSMFSSCSSLTSIDLTGFDTSNVTDMSSMFSSCSMLATIDLEKFNTEKTTDMGSMFSYCESLTSLDLTGFDASSVTDMSYMLRGCESLASLKTAGISVPNVTSMMSVFSACNKLDAITRASIVNQLLSTNNGKCTDWCIALFSGCPDESIDCSSLGLDTSNVEKMNSMFSNCPNLTSIDLAGLDTTNVWMMSYMFSGSYNLAALDLSSIYTSSVTAVSGMLQFCTMLNSLTLPAGIDAKNTGLRDAVWKGTDGTEYPSTSEMLAANASRESGETTYQSTAHEGWSSTGTCEWQLADGVMTVRPIDGKSGTLGTWTSTYQYAPWYVQRSNVTSVVFEPGVKAQTCNRMFYGFSSLVSMDISELDTSSVTDMAWMFRGCSSLPSLDLTGLNTSNVTNMSYMFGGYSGGYGLYSVEGATSSGYMLESYTEPDYNDGCKSLASINLEGIDTSKVTNMCSMFYGCTSLTSLDLSGFATSNVTNMYSMFERCTSLATLDLTGFDTSNTLAMGLMFCNCESLETIKVDSKWSTGNVSSSSYMFYGCTSLVGGKGTTYDSNQTDVTYARIDGGPDSDTPGYLTAAETYNVGDVNDNEIINIMDAQIVFDMVNGVWGETSTYDKLLAALNNGWDFETLTKAADADGNGKVEVNDARAIQYYAHYGEFEKTV